MAAIDGFAKSIGEVGRSSWLESISDFIGGRWRRGRRGPRVRQRGGGASLTPVGVLAATRRRRQRGDGRRGGARLQRTKWSAVRESRVYTFLRGPPLLPYK